MNHEIEGFASVWALTRKRFITEIEGLTDQQLRWRIHPNSLSIGQMAVHVAGAEMNYAAQLLDLDLPEDLRRVRRCSGDGVANDNPFPFPDHELTAALVQHVLATAQAHVEKMFAAASPASLEREILSAAGQPITGGEGLKRMAMHAAYHHGQAYLLISAPNFGR